MNQFWLLTIYCLLILLFSLFGGVLPFLGRVPHSRLQLYLSVAAGVMLGASFFHVMPEAIDKAKEWFGWWMSLGVVGLFCIERFIAPHSHELNHGNGSRRTNGDLPPNEDHNHHDHAHHHDLHGPVPGEPQAAAPSVAGWAAVFGLTIHTFMNGFGLAGAAVTDAEKTGVALPGLAMFLAIFLHKPADALAISMVLSRKGVSRRKLALVQFGFACMVAVGVAAFLFARHHVAEYLESQLTGAALAFSAGTFLFIALSDLLPEVQFHKHDRIQLFLALTLGVVAMGGIALLEGHNHEGHGHTAARDHHGGEHEHDD
jgi:zinc and cadmium transporter